MEPTETGNLKGLITCSVVPGLRPGILENPNFAWLWETFVGPRYQIAIPINGKRNPEEKQAIHVILPCNSGAPAFSCLCTVLLYSNGPTKRNHSYPIQLTDNDSSWISHSRLDKPSLSLYENQWDSTCVCIYVYIYIYISLSRVGTN